MVTLPNGIDYAVCHVRGGGELGEAWRLGGKDANKPNTWRDLIACGEQLIAGGDTTKDKLFIIGGSAGGITMGARDGGTARSLRRRVRFGPGGQHDALRVQPNGPPNIPEFGTIKDEKGFRNLLAMDSVQHVKPGVKYPPIMITTGLNDPRVSRWEPAKLAASLRAAGDQPGAAADRRESRPRHRLDQDADGSALRGRRHHPVAVGRWRSGPFGGRTRPKSRASDSAESSTGICGGPNSRRTGAGMM